MSAAAPGVPGSHPEPGKIKLRLPATSANLGPGFDAVALAMALYLTIEAEWAAEFAIEATGRDANLCRRVENNLILDTYSDVLHGAKRIPVPLRLALHNEIPLGMGCGSSAAALLAGVFLANHFGDLGWDKQKCMEEACRREGHPDNVAACAMGYLTVSSPTPDVWWSEVVAVTCGQASPWKLLLALPKASLSTEKARGMLPGQYSRADAVFNVQRTALLVAAFALGRGDLLQVAMQDRIHQPYRSEACPLLPKLLPLAGEPGILGVALSGAGPGVLVVAGIGSNTGEVAVRIRRAAGDPGLEVVETSVAGGASSE
jgi:homoserine kinase